MESHAQPASSASGSAFHTQAPINPYDIHMATIVEKRRETEGIETYRLKLVDEKVRHAYRFSAGQFNMVYAFGVGEVAISIVSDPDEPEFLDHTIRAVGRVTNAIARLQLGDALRSLRSFSLSALRGRTTSGTFTPLRSEIVPPVVMMQLA